MRYFIEFAYDGTHYFGFQIQPNQISIQEVIEFNLSLLLNKRIKIIGAGRTDRGVHARQMFAHFDCEKELSKYFIKKINAVLPKDIVVYSIFKVNSDAHARFNAESRTYRYYLLRKMNPFESLFAFPIYYNLEISLMEEAANYLLEINDFKSFSKLHSNNQTTFCKINEAKFTSNRSKTQLIFTITSNRFLRNMVRAIVGTLLHIGKGKLSISDFKSTIEQKNDILTKISVPPYALFLEKIKYPNWIFFD